MTRATPITFLSPIVEVIVQGEPSTYCFLLMSGGGTLQLTYPTKADAKEAQTTLNKSPDVHKVPSMRLFQAIQKALSEQIAGENPRDRTQRPNPG